MEDSHEARLKVLARLRARMDRIEVLLAAGPALSKVDPVGAMVEPVSAASVRDVHSRTVRPRPSRQGLRQRASA